MTMLFTTEASALQTALKLSDLHEVSLNNFPIEQFGKDGRTFFRIKNIPNGRFNTEMGKPFGALQVLLLTDGSQQQ